MEIEDIIRLMKAYDFKKNSAASFSKMYGITPKTIKKLLLQHSIPHNTHRVNIKQPRDVHGRFKIAIKSTTKSANKSTTKSTTKPITTVEQITVDDSKKLSGKPAEKQLKELRKFYK
jgi:hypothetical protein